MPEIARRSVSRGVMWTIPVLAVAASAPAVAASCTPTTVDHTVAVKWVSTLTSFSEGDDGGDNRRIRYTFTNDGPDSLPAGAGLNIHLVVTVDSADWSSTVTVEGTSNNAEASVNSSNAPDGASGTVTYTFDVSVRAEQDVPAGEAMIVDIVMTYGLLGGASSDLGRPEESVTMQSPQSVTNVPTCVTTIVDGTIDGASDGTTWGY